MKRDHLVRSVWCHSPVPHSPVPHSPVTCGVLAGCRAAETLAVRRTGYSLPSFVFPSLFRGTAFAVKRHRLGCSGIPPRLLMGTALAVEGHRLQGDCLRLSAIVSFATEGHRRRERIGTLSLEREYLCLGRTSWITTAALWRFRPF